MMFLPLISAVSLFLSVLYFSAALMPVDTNRELSSKARELPPSDSFGIGPKMIMSDEAFDPKGFVCNKLDDKEPPKEGHRLQDFLKPSRSLKLGNVLRYIESHGDILTAISRQKLFSSSKYKNLLSEVYTSCADQQEPGINFNSVLFGYIRSMHKKSDLLSELTLSEKQILLQKKYLMAIYERKRLSLVLDENRYTSQQSKNDIKNYGVIKNESQRRRLEKQKNIQRLQRIISEYPMARTPYLFTDELKMFIGGGFGSIYNVPETYEHIDEFLFEINSLTELTQLPKSKSNSPGSRLANQLIDPSQLPRPIEKTLITSLETSFQSIFKATQQYCSLSECEQVKIDTPSVTTHINNTIEKNHKTANKNQDQEDQLIKQLVQPVCDCNINDKGKWVSFSAQNFLAGGTASAGLVCLFVTISTNPLFSPACPLFFVGSAALTAAGVVNTTQTLTRIAHGSHLIDILHHLPGKNTAVIESLDQKNNSQMKALAADALLTVSAGTAAHLATVKAPGLWQDALERIRELRRLKPNVVSMAGIKPILKQKLDGGVRYFFNTVNPFARGIRMSGNYSIAAGKGTDRKIAYEILQGLGTKQFVIFIDVNYLGVVNYFKRKSRDGDEYLDKVAKSINDILDKYSNPGINMRWGGDEFLLSIDSAKFPHTSKEELQEKIKQFGHEIIQVVHENKEIMAIFAEHRIHVKRWYDTIQNALTIDGIPEDVLKNFTPDELEFATNNFKDFLDRHKELGSMYMTELERMKQSISIGAVEVNEKGFEKAIEEAENIATQVKTIFKSKSGLKKTEFKYGTPEILPIDEAIDVPIDPHAIPEMQAPLMGSDY